MDLPAPMPRGLPRQPAAAESQAGPGLLGCVSGVVIAGVCANVGFVVRVFLFVCLFVCLLLLLFLRKYGKPDQIRKEKKIFFDTGL